MLRSLVTLRQRFEEILCFHLQGRIFETELSSETSVNYQPMRFHIAEGGILDHENIIHLVYSNSVSFAEPTTGF